MGWSYGNNTKMMRTPKVMTEWEPRRQIKEQVNGLREGQSGPNFNCIKCTELDTYYKSSGLFLVRLGICFSDAFLTAWLE